MAKRKDLLLNEATIKRMMGIAGIGSLANPFLKEGGRGGFNPAEFGEGPHEKDPWNSDFEDENLGIGDDSGDFDDEELDDEEFGMHDFDPEDEIAEDDKANRELAEFSDDYDDDEGFMFEGEEETDDEFMGESDTVDEAKDKTVCESCGEKHKGSCKKEKIEENVRKSMKRLKRLLEQADMPPPPAEDEEEGGEELPEPAPEAPGAGGELESKVKDFVKKLGELVQETLGVEVTVEDGEGEEDPEMEDLGGEMDDMGGDMPPAEDKPAPAPMEEAINRLVNKVVRRVKARLMEARGEKAKIIDKKRKLDAKKKEADKKSGLMKEKQAAAKKKEAEEKKKKMEMKKKKEAAKKK
jgi:hypothetical protein